MAIQSSEDFSLSNERKINAMLTEGLKLGEREATLHGQMLVLKRYLAAHPDRLLLLDVIHFPYPPAASCLTRTAQAGDEGRSAIGGSKPESRPT